MYALGMSDKDIQEQIKEIFGCNLSPDMISDITDKIIPEVQEWQYLLMLHIFMLEIMDR
jgi:putative transposase